jgi:hypothetical protein
VIRDDIIECRGQRTARAAPLSRPWERHRRTGEKCALLAAEQEVMVRDRIPPRHELLEPRSAHASSHIAHQRTRPDVEIETSKVSSDRLGLGIAAVEASSVRERGASADTERERPIQEAALPGCVDPGRKAGIARRYEGRATRSAARLRSGGLVKCH